jgi:hypothetical protein
MQSNGGAVGPATGKPPGNHIDLTLEPNERRWSC